MSDASSDTNEIEGHIKEEEKDVHITAKNTYENTNETGKNINDVEINTDETAENDDELGEDANETEENVLEIEQDASKRAENSYPPEPWYIKIRTTCYTILVILFFQCYVRFTLIPSMEDGKGFEEDVTSDGAPFKVYKLHKTKSPSTDLYEQIFGAIRNLIHFMLFYTGYYGSSVLVIVVVLVNFYRPIFMRRRISAIAHFYNIEEDLISEIKMDRIKCVKARAQKIEKEERSDKYKLISDYLQIYRHISNDYLITALFLDPPDYMSLQSVCLSPSPKKYLDFADTALFMRQILEGVQYLHDHNIYHLNLQPRNIWVSNNVWRFKRRIKIGGFKFAKQQLEGPVFSFQKVGLPPAFRPPEYLAGKEMDAVKFDSWSVGVIAFEAFTGGMLTVESDLMKPPVQNGEELIRPRLLLSQRYFMSALQSTWNILGNFYFRHYTTTMDISVKYDILYDDVLADCIDFVRLLMHPDYKRRYTICEAFELPFMRKLAIKRKTSLFNPFRYF